MTAGGLGSGRGRARSFRRMGFDGYPARLQAATHLHSVYLPRDTPPAVAVAASQSPPRRPACARRCAGAIRQDAAQGPSGSSVRVELSPRGSTFKRGDGRGAGAGGGRRRGRLVRFAAGGHGARGAQRARVGGGGRRRAARGRGKRQGGGGGRVRHPRVPGRGASGASGANGASGASEADSPCLYRREREGGASAECGACGFENFAAARRCGACGARALGEAAAGGAGAGEHLRTR